MGSRNSKDVQKKGQRIKKEEKERERERVRVRKRKRKRRKRNELIQNQTEK